MAKRVGKYYPLYEYLVNSGKDEIPLTFSDVEKILNIKLPGTSRTIRGWWSNRSHGVAQAGAWMKAGYHVEDLDLTTEKVTFRKPTAVQEVRRDGDTVLWDGRLIKSLRYHMGLSQTDMAQELGVRQQTISEWETGAYLPKRSMSKYLTMVAEKASFKYGGEDEEGAEVASEEASE